MCHVFFMTIRFLVVGNTDAEIPSQAMSTASDTVASFGNDEDDYPRPSLDSFHRLFPPNKPRRHRDKVQADDDILVQLLSNTSLDTHVSDSDPSEKTLVEDPPTLQLSTSKRHMKVSNYFIRENGLDLTKSYDKSPCTNTNSKKHRDNIKKKRHFHYTTIADRLRTVSWNNSSQPNWCG